MSTLKVPPKAFPTSTSQHQAIAVSSPPLYSRRNRQGIRNSKTSRALSGESSSFDASVSEESSRSHRGDFAFTSKPPGPATEAAGISKIKLEANGVPGQSVRFARAAASIGNRVPSLVRSRLQETSLRSQEVLRERKEFKEEVTESKRVNKRPRSPSDASPRISHRPFPRRAPTESSTRFEIGRSSRYLNEHIPHSQSKSHRQSTLPKVHNSLPTNLPRRDLRYESSNAGSSGGGFRFSNPESIFSNFLGKDDGESKREELERLDRQQTENAERMAMIEAEHRRQERLRVQAEETIRSPENRNYTVEVGGSRKVIPKNTPVEHERARVKYVVASPRFGVRPEEEYRPRTGSYFRGPSYLRAGSYPRADNERILREDLGGQRASNTMDLNQKSGKLGWQTKRSEISLSIEVSSTISRDKTLGECARNAELLANFATKNQRLFSNPAPEENAPTSERENNYYVSKGSHNTAVSASDPATTAFLADAEAEDRRVIRNDYIDERGVDRRSDYDRREAEDYIDRRPFRPLPRRYSPDSNSGW